MKKKKQLESGQALVEMAFVFILLIPIVLVILDMGRAIYYYSVVYNAAREGARAGVIPDDYDAGWDIQPVAIRDAVLSKAVGVDINADSGCESPYYYRADPDSIPNPTCDIFIEGPTTEIANKLYSVTVSVRTKFIPVTPLIEEILQPLIDEDPDRPGFDIWGVATMTIEK